MTLRDGYVTTDDGLRLFYRRAGDSPEIVLFLNGVTTAEDFAPVAVGRSIVFIDSRNRGRSDAVRDVSQIERGIHHEVDDLEACRRHFGVDRVDIIGFSYGGVSAALYAMTHAARTRRVVLLGAMAADQRRQYAPPLSNADDTLQQALAALGELMKEQATSDPIEFCHRFWAIINPIYVVNPADVSKLTFARCDAPNERNFMPTLMGHILPSISKLTLTDDDFARVTAPVLVIHGNKDRSSPYGAGRDWARQLPNARLLTIDNAAHVPWIEAPDLVFGSLATFFAGGWPAAAESIAALEIS